ncbi:stage III sporulation protein AG [Brevibacillus sp. B_LB10_24]|jgi:stage III sporulation protein AG|uniref:stage III sporulation protein AG n=1 Tax=Brevibacillus TaxID=55080 RepID=UPI0003173518|nr:stage III sporulation protein AG [Brevibacillus massiliensis]
MLDKFKQLWAGGTSEPGQKNQKKMRPIHYFIILLGLGIVAMIFTDFLSVQPDSPLPGSFNQAEPPTGEQASLPALGGTPGKDQIREYENLYETRLEEMLEGVIGVGKVEVMVNLDSTPEIVVEKNSNSRTAATKETDKDRATRDQTDQSKDEQVVVIQGSKQDQPIVVKTLKPKVRGVLVVAKGADNIQVKAWITEAVQKVLDVPAYRISILPKKG